MLLDRFFVPVKCPCCGETTFVVCGKEGEVLDVIDCDPFKEYLDAKEKIDKKES